MPIYGYRCASCDKEFETLQDINENSVHSCPKCGGEAKRLYYPVGIIFRGSGFHVTDYPRKSSSEKSDAPDAGKQTAANGGEEKASSDEGNRAKA